MKKLLCILITLAMVLPCIGMMTVSATDGASAFSTSSQFTLAPDNLPSATAVTGLVNGDAESGLKNWGTLYCTSDAENVVDPDDENNNVIKFSPGASCNYATVTYNIGSAIIEDSDMGYNGFGAGTYTISFRAKAEENKGGTFTGYIHSPWHHEMGYEYNGYVLKNNTFKAGSSFEMTDEWTEISYEVIITEAWLENIYTCYALGATRVYDLSIRLDGYKNAFSEGCFGYYIDDVSVSYQASAPATPTPELPSGDKIFENGNAEDGLTNWETIHGGKIELVQPGANGTDNAVKFTPTGSIYNSVAFDLGPAIVDDAQAGYYGYGAGSYLVSFWAKAEKEGLFKVILNSQMHMDATSVNNHIPSLNAEEGTYIIADDIYLTTEWEYYSVLIDVSEEWLEAIKLLRAYQVPKYERAYELEFRIDGSATEGGDYAFKDDLFGYSVDEIMIEDIFELYPDEKIFENGDAEDGLTNWETIHGGKIELVQPGANGTDNAVKFTPTGSIYNSVAFDLGPAIVYDEAEGYYGYGAGSYLVSFWAKAEKEGLFKVILNSQLHMGASSVNNHIPFLDTDLNTWIIADDVYLTTEWDYYSVWIDVSEDWLDMLALLKAYQVPNYERAYELEFRIDGSATEGGDYAFKDDLFGYTVDEIMIEDITDLEIPEPVGTIYTALEEIETENNLYFRSEFGLITEWDIEDGKITKSFMVGNLGEETIRVKLEMQSTVKIDGDTKWAGQTDGEYIYIEPLTTELLTYSMDVNADNTVTVKGTDCELDTFFYRFDIENGEDEKVVPAGTSVVFYGEGEDYYIVSNLKNFVKNSWEIEDAYGYYTVNGWVEVEGNWYYFFLGEMLYETWWFDETGVFYLDENGILVTNKWLYDGEDWCYVGENGYLVTNAWVKDSVGWCYVDEEGYMVTDQWILDSVGWCYIGSDGYCVTDCWMQDSIGWCYLNSEGRMATNTWILDSVGWCYVGSDGYCVTNCWMADSVGWVYLDSEGRMKTNAWVMDSVGWCYVGSDGYAMTNCWMADSVGWCYLDSEGRMVTNDFVYDSNGKCWLDANGYWNGIYY